ncbi:DNA polymerase IV (DinB-like DNA polymerase) [Methanolinea mesophila]|uniref:DNA polymerase IV n=1 Tax=Methanolinea mesophila TaxID=547055 RepID=UPI001AE31449|nr:DNA polymerase IV [Methanolinea mesophila]MBP1927551.1 DNA polymerase IV (DinB-like DNA polymerase) [Methanolinea mesophila]
MPNTVFRIILHLDMDSFYASVEIREHPDLAGKPVVVGADPLGGHGRGVVSTASYEARKFGIHSAMPISKAYRLCPDAIFITPHFSLYERTSARIMEILSRYSDKLEQVSIDEAYLDLTPAGTFETAKEIATRIKRAIREEERLTCSIGIGHSKVVAKIASDYKKPDGLTVVRPEETEGFLFPLPVEKIPGVGKKTARELHEMGIVLIGDLAHADIQRLQSRFGRWALAMQRLAFGEDEREVEQRDSARSISRETTFTEDTGDIDLILGVLDDLMKDVHHTMRDEGYMARTVTVKVRYEDFQTRQRARSLVHPATDLRQLNEIARTALLESLGSKKVRLIGVKLSGLRTREKNQKTIGDFG